MPLHRHNYIWTPFPRVPESRHPSEPRSPSATPLHTICTRIQSSRNLSDSTHCQSNTLYRYIPQYADESEPIASDVLRNGCISCNLHRARRQSFPASLSAGKPVHGDTSRAQGDSAPRCRLPHLSRSPDLWRASRTRRPFISARGGLSTVHQVIYMYCLPSARVEMNASSRAQTAE